MRSYRLLIVDDDAVDRQLYRKLLGQSGPGACHIQQAVSGTIGLATLQADKFDCLLLDFSLPDMTGLEFLNAAAVDGELPCAVVLITGQGNEAIAVEAMKRGVKDYLVKDQVNASSLWRAMTQAVTQTELEQRLAGLLRKLTGSNFALEQEVATRKAAEAELHAAKDAAEQANQAKTRFVAMVTHELRTPLNGILGYAQLLRIEAGLSTRQDAHVGAMMLAGGHLLEMIDRVLDFSSIESGRMELHPERMSVPDLIEGCIAFISPVATEHALSLRVVNFHDAPRHIVADPARLRQVLLNLLGNAVKYTDAGTVEVRLRAGAAPGGLRIEITDTGRGINETSRNRLFQDFERLDAATSVEGTGLGLAIAARIVKLMGGTINYGANPNGANPNGAKPSHLGPNGARPNGARPNGARPNGSGQTDPSADDAGPNDPRASDPRASNASENAANANAANANAGSVFWFELPPGEAAAPIPSDPEKSVSSPAVGRRVLLVDDMKINRDIIGAFLSAAGHAVTFCESGSQAIRLAAEQPFDLILMDVRMPEMDGLEATRHIRALPGAHGQMPILALTAYTFPGQAAQCRDAGMDGHIGKPVDYATLISAIDDAIARVPPFSAKN